MIGALLALAAVPAPTVYADTLKQALAEAYQSNPDLRSAWYQLRAANEQRPQALAAWLPDVSVVGSANRTNNRNVYEPPYQKTAYNSRSRSGGLQVSQPITSGGAEFARLEEADQLIKRQRALLVDTEQQLLLSAVDAYTNVILTRRVVDYRRQNLQLLRRILAVAERQLAVSDRTLSDVALTRSRVLQTEAALVEAESQAEQAKNYYVRVTGKEPANLASPLPFKPLPFTPQEIKDAAGRFGPAVLAAVYAEQAAQANLKAQQRGMLPVVSLQGQIQYKNDNDDSDNYAQARGSTITKSIQLQVKIPLYQSGGEYSRIRQAKATASQRLADLESARGTAIRQALDAQEKYQASERATKLLESQLSSVKVAVDALMRETTSGFRTITDLLSAEQDEISAQINYETAKRDHVLGSYQLLCYLGGLTARSLELSVEYYDIDGDYNRIKWKIFGFSVD